MNDTHERSSPTRRRWRVLAVVAVVAIVIVAAGATAWERSRPQKPVFQPVCGTQTNVGVVGLVPAVIEAPTFGQVEPPATELACAIA
jgi:hypothetical protein